MNKTCGWSGRGARRRGGFTLVELILVMLILTTLAAIVVPKFVGRSQQAKETAAAADIANFSTALDAFEVDNGFYPASGEGLLDLLDQPNNAPNWRGPYLKEIPNDPWGSPYIYEYPGKHNARGYDLLSMGADGQMGGVDDIDNWTPRRASK